MKKQRLGIVVFQFDDGTAGHYTHAFRVLETHKLKGSFGVVTGMLDRPSRLTSAQVKEMHEAGHEIHDHTLRHEAGFWGNPENRSEWPKRIDESLAILRSLGVKTRGWNQPGGKGQGWSQELRAELAKHYDYAAGRVSLRSEQARNIHWRLRDDPLSLGRGGVCSWGYNGGKGDPAKETECIKRLIADGIQWGLVVIPLWHRVKDEDGTAQGLEAVCKFVRKHKLPSMVMADAVAAIQNPRKHYARRIEQMPNPRLTYDIDVNGRPDGYLRCAYATDLGKKRPKERTVEFVHGTTTWVYGPEPGKTRLSLTARCAAGEPVKVTPKLMFTEVSDQYEYSTGEIVECGRASLGSTWQKLEFPVIVGKQVDRVKIEFGVSPQCKIQVREASWRVVD